MDTVKFFLGANTPNGFYSLFNELYDPFTDWQMYIIKGGPGTGKSTLMKAVAEEAENRGYYVERIYCSSDPSSLDGVIIPELKTSIADGTSPHIIEPVFPGVCEHIINLGECWDIKKLSDNTVKIKMISNTNSAAHKKCVKYMRAAKLIESEIDKCTNSNIDFEKLERYVKRFSDNYLLKCDNNNLMVKYRFLSSLSPSGIFIMEETISNYCDKIVVFKDSANLSQFLMNSIKNEAASKNINMIICKCPMNSENKIDHIIFPELRLGVFTSNSYHKIKGDKTVSTSRFIKKKNTLEHKNSLAFLKKTKSEIINEAIEALKSAKSAHDILESYYIDAMDFNKVNDIKNKIINDIFNVSRETLN